LAADGASVAITYTKGANAAASVAKEIEGVGGKAIAIQADATDADAVKAAVEKTVATFDRLDILIGPPKESVHLKCVCPANRRHFC
jgi:3-oxoacyl-[acyl-carrier protein] reductase